MNKLGLVLLISILSFKVSAQLSLTNGFIFPPVTKNEPIHILLIPVELHGGECDSINNQQCFPPGQLPVNIDDYFDATLPAGGPQKYFSKYLYQASFGNLIVLGDYLKECVHVNYCPTSMPPSPQSWTKVINAEIKKQFPDLPLKHNTPLKEFDKYNLSDNTNVGRPKLPVNGGNKRFDCVIYLIKNYPGYGGNNGFGENVLTGAAELTADMGIDQGAIFGHTGDVSSIKFIMEEFFHGLFGGNNWHGGGGKSNHTFMNRPIQWGIESQNGSSQVVSGYDRWVFNWVAPGKNFSIGALDTNNIEVNSDLKIPASPVVSTFVLRDFVTTGDVVRIKLPHINCSSPFLKSGDPVTGEEKNNYLWIENHQLLSGSVEDQNLNYSLANSQFCGNWPVCGQYWTPGLFCAIQVGKDDETGGGEIYGGQFKDPNGLGSWMFPLSANGFHDFKYGAIVPSGPPCVWSNPFVPFDLTSKENTKPNPFCGYSFEYGTPNTDGSDRLHDKDANQGVAFLDNNPTANTLHFERSQFGNENTSFKCNGQCPAGGKEILSLSTNPSPVTVMTLTSNDNYKGSLKLNPQLEDSRTHVQPNGYLNRTIYLNGISISIINENYLPEKFGSGAVKIQVRWDKYDVENDVRWCADSIRLSANDFIKDNYSLNIKNGATVLIDRSLSPTYDYSDSAHVNFTVPTVFTCLMLSKIHIEENGSIVVDNGSIFELNDSSTIDIEKNAKIIVRNGGKLIMNSLSQINTRGGQIIIERDGEMYYSNSALINSKKLSSASRFKSIIRIKDKKRSKIVELGK